MLWFSSYVIVFLVLLKSKGEKNRRHYILTGLRKNFKISRKYFVKFLGYLKTKTKDINKIKIL